MSCLLVTACLVTTVNGCVCEVCVCFLVCKVYDVESVWCTVLCVYSVGCDSWCYLCAMCVVCLYGMHAYLYVCVRCGAGGIFVFVSAHTMAAFLHYCLLYRKIEASVLDPVAAICSPHFISCLLHKFLHYSRIKIWAT